MSSRQKPSDEAGLGVPKTQPALDLGHSASAGLESSQASGTNTADRTERQIDDLVGVFTDPIIVMPGGWGETLPEWIKGRITLDRLAENMRALHGEQRTGTDAEAMAYLYTASLTYPMSEHWANIYMYVFTKVMGDKEPGDHRREDKVPEDLRKEEITDYEKGMLGDLKEWLWKQRVKVRQERHREKRATEKAEAEARAPKQMGLPLEKE